jgi:hypothetical protein
MFCIINNLLNTKGCPRCKDQNPSLSANYLSKVVRDSPIATRIPFKIPVSTQKLVQDAPTEYY